MRKKGWKGIRQKKMEGKQVMKHETNGGKQKWIKYLISKEERKRGRMVKWSERQTERERADYRCTLRECHCSSRFETLFKRRHWRERQSTRRRKWSTKRWGRRWDRDLQRGMSTIWKRNTDTDKEMRFFVSELAMAYTSWRLCEFMLSMTTFSLVWSSTSSRKKNIRLCVGGCLLFEIGSKQDKYFNSCWQTAVPLHWCPL